MHEDIASLSAQKYSDQLTMALGRLSDDVKHVAQIIIESNSTAIKMRDRLTASDLAFHHSLLAALPPHKREPLINQYSLGLGSDTAKVIFIGTEHAYNLETTVPFALEAVGLSILWLCGGTPKVTSKIAGQPWGYGVPFHIHPNALYRVQETTRGQHTWKVLASIMEKVVGISRHELLTGYKPGLGGLVYQIELSAYPSKQSSGGKTPTPERVNFLSKLLAAFKETANVVIFHGKMWAEPWSSIRQQLSRIFLGIGQNDVIDFVIEDLGRNHIMHADLKGRRVIILEF